MANMAEPIQTSNPQYTVEQLRAMADAEEAKIIAKKKKALENQAKAAAIQAKVDAEIDERTEYLVGLYRASQELAIQQAARQLASTQLTRKHGGDNYSMGVTPLIVEAEYVARVARSFTVSELEEYVAANKGGKAKAIGLYDEQLAAKHKADKNRPK
jgi:branched-subunit amino acid aminotransferase/4-amino-4-deoxychorismate lyase